MAQLKDLIVNETTRLNGDAFVNKLYINGSEALTLSNLSSIVLGKSNIAEKSIEEKENN